MPLKDQTKKRKATIKLVTTSNPATEISPPDSKKRKYPVLDLPIACVKNIFKESNTDGGSLFNINSGDTDVGDYQIRATFRTVLSEEERKKRRRLYNNRDDVKKKRRERAESEDFKRKKRLYNNDPAVKERRRLQAQKRREEIRKALSYYKQQNQTLHQPELDDTVDMSTP